MDLRRALKILEIEEVLNNKKKEAGKEAIAGRFECCNAINEAIRIIKEFLSESK